MPIYEYKCAACDHRFSVLQRISEGNEHVICERCGTPRPIKQFSAFASPGNSGGTDRVPSGSSHAGSRFT